LIQGPDQVQQVAGIAAPPLSHTTPRGWMGDKRIAAALKEQLKERNPSPLAGEGAQRAGEGEAASAAQKTDKAGASFFWLADASRPLSQRSAPPSPARGEGLQ
jgi:hypothetical protein